MWKWLILKANLFTRRNLGWACALCIGTTLAGAQPADPLAAPPPPQGLKGKVYFIQPLMSLPDFDRLEPVGIVYTNPLYVRPRPSSVGFPDIPNRPAWFAINYTGKIYVSRPGDYRFLLVTDDGSKLYIDGKLLIDNNHGLGTWTGEKSIPLSGGMHSMRLSYFQGPFNHHYIALMLSVTPPGRRSSKPFDLRDFPPPERAEDWKFGSPADFAEPPDPGQGRVKLKDAIAAVEKMAPLHPPLSVEEQSGFFNQVSVSALHYGSSLPNFKCTEVVRQYSRAARPGMIPIAPSGKPAEPEGWIAGDSRTFALDYFNHRATFQLLQVDGRAPARKDRTARGTVSEGEFGAALLAVFAPESQTKFRWDHWTRLRGRLTAVYAYRTGRQHSQYKLAVGTAARDRKTAIAGRRGFVYADYETRLIMRLEGAADEIPRGFPATAVSSALDYELVEAGDKSFLLPQRIEQLTKSAQTEFRGVVEFRDYRGIRPAE